MTEDLIIEIKLIKLMCGEYCVKKINGNMNDLKKNRFFLFCLYVFIVMQYWTTCVEMARQNLETEYLEELGMKRDVEVFHVECCFSHGDRAVWRA